MSGAIRIIGIDPGLRRTGWGVVDSLGSRLSFVAAGTILPHNTKPLAERLCIIHDGLVAVLQEFSPHEAAVEATFVNADAGATLKLGQARGVAMLVPALAGLPVAEYAPNAVKKAIVGAGHAEKAQIAHDGRDAPAAGEVRHRRFGRCAGGRHMPRASSRGGGAAAQVSSG